MTEQEEQDVKKSNFMFYENLYLQLLELGLGFALNRHVSTCL